MNYKQTPLFWTACLVLLGMASVTEYAYGQELDCTVSVDFRQLTGSNWAYLRDLSRLAEEYISNQTWTEDRFQENERVSCTMQIVFEEALTLSRFRTRLIVTSRRPIYGTAQNTNVLLINDQEWEFDYAQGTPLIFDIERFDPLTSVLDFYALLVLGYDYDTFSELGGTDLFNRARRIAEKAQGAAGWSQIGSDRGRTSLITQILDPRLEPLRKAYFAYHYHGLDHFTQQTEEARGAVLDVVASLQTLYDEVNRQYVLDLFFGTKYQELASIFLDSPLSGQAYQLLTDVDPSHLTSYNRLIE